MTKTDFAHWIEKKFLDWQQQQGGRRPAKKFAEWLGFEEAAVNHWLNGKRTPERGNVYLLALKLGLGIYDVLGLPRPDEGLYQVDVHWHMLKDDEKAAIQKIAKPAHLSTPTHSRKTRTAPGLPGAFCLGDFRNALALEILHIE